MANQQEEEDFDYDDKLETEARPPPGARNVAIGVASSREKTTLVLNQPYDEAVELSDDGMGDDSVDTHALSASNGRTPGQAGAGGAGRGRVGGKAVDSPPVATSAVAGGEYHTDVEIPGSAASSPAQSSSASSVEPAGRPILQQQQPSAAAVPSTPLQSVTNPSSASPSPSGDGAGGFSTGGATAGIPGLATAAGTPINPGIVGLPPKKAAYNPADFAALKVHEDIRALFEHIGAYRPRNVELATTMKCFVPEYIPAVGDMDPFIKPPRPDGAEDRCGLGQLDEPGPLQSDPTVLDLQLRNLSKRAGVEPLLVRSIEHADRNPKEVQRWISAVAEVHKSRPLPTVPYGKPMPDTEALMQEWPPAVEELLATAQLPSAELDLTTEEYARAACALLDIPVYASPVHSLHVLFTLYNDFRANQHFANQAAGGGGGAGGGVDAPLSQA